MILALGLIAGARLRGGDAASYTSRNRDVSALNQPLWRVPAFRFESQRGTPVSSKELEGHVWIADFIFTTCTNLCPMMSSKLVHLQRALPDPALRFVSFSVDPEHDTAAALDAYAKRWNGGDPRWLLLRSTPKELPEFTSDMRVPCVPTTDPENPLMHSGLFFLIDATLNVRAVYDPADPDALSQIRRDVKRLSGGQPGPDARSASQAPSSVAAGEHIYTQLGCEGCHYDARIAPRLDPLWGSEVTFQDGTKRIVDDDYVREAILLPGVRLVKGYAPLMPSYEDKISATELESLLLYLHARKNSCAGDCGAAKPASSAVDPICEMSVVVTPETPRAERNGTTHYFCSEHCREAFLRPGDRR
jgi:protein SCO1/2